MSDSGSDSYPGLDLSEFTQEDFEHIDAAVANIQAELNLAAAGVSFQSEINELISSHSQQLVESVDPRPTVTGKDDKTADVSFDSDGFDLNLRTLSTEDFEQLDNENPVNGGPSISIEIVDSGDSEASSLKLDPHTDMCKTEVCTTKEHKSPLEQFRSNITLSVTDLVSPAWCEVQYDYGLRGKRSRPIHQRPKSFVSARGKTISPEITIVKKNDVQTRQGRAVHKELEREIRFEELQVEITTDETRWALRLVNMLACLKSMSAGFTREMPVFGILHDEVVVGIMDEVIKVEVPSLSDHVLHKGSSKRLAETSNSNPSAKRPRNKSSSPQNMIGSYFEGSSRQAENIVEDISPSARHPRSMLCIKDNKTRKNHYIPSEPDMYSGRLQLMIYRRLLSELLATNPPYNFTPIWEKLNLRSSTPFPTKFLIQAQLIEDDTGFQTTCLNDLAALWHNVVNESNIIGVDENLELVYCLRASDETQKGNMAAYQQRPNKNDEEGDLARAIAASLAESLSGQENLAGPSSTAACNAMTLEVAETPFIEDQDAVLDSEDVQLQWALQESALNTPGTSSVPVSFLNRSSLDTNSRTNDKERSRGKGKAKDYESQDESIRRHRIIGSKRFLHNDKELDTHLTHVLKWWRGSRKPEGVPLNLTYRCSVCEYKEDCEWRAEKALELSSKKLRLP